MNNTKSCINSFSKTSFSILIQRLIEYGYVIDHHNIHGVAFSSNQIEFLDQKAFDQLLRTFDLHTNININKTGAFFQTQGAFYIIYDSDRLTYEDAKNILSEYVNQLEP